MIKDLSIQYLIQDKELLNKCFMGQELNIMTILICKNKNLLLVISQDLS